MALTRACLEWTRHEWSTFLVEEQSLCRVHPHHRIDVFDAQFSCFTPRTFAFGAFVCSQSVMTSRMLQCPHFRNQFASRRPQKRISMTVTSFTRDRYPNTLRAVLDFLQSHAVLTLIYNERICTSIVTESC